MWVAFWLASAPLSVGLALACVLTATLVFEPNQGAWVLLIAAGLLLSAFRARLHEAGARARILSGNSPLLGFHAPNAQRERALIDELVSVFRATGKRPTIVGCGWGFFIGRRIAKGAVFTHNLTGRVDEARPFLFYAGTTIATVCSIFEREFGKTFWSTPTNQHISIGSWLARSCHGNAGPSGHASSYAAETVYVVDLETAETAARGIQTLAYSDAKVGFDAEPTRWFLLAVDFAPARLADDFYLQKKLCEVKADRGVSPGLREWLSDEAVLRVLFFGSARRLGLGVTYTKLVSLDSAVDRMACGCCCRTRHVDPHCCSTACMSMQLDTCSIFGGWYEHAKVAWRGVIKMGDANRFTPASFLDLLPSIPLIVLGCGLLNFEFFFILRKSLDGGRRAQERAVQMLCNDVLRLFQGAGSIWGRSELRMGAIDRGLVCLDFIAAETDAPRIIQAILPHIHASAIALHDSKYESEFLVKALQREVCKIDLRVLTQSQNPQTHKPQTHKPTNPKPTNPLTLSRDSRPKRRARFSHKFNKHLHYTKHHRWLFF